MPVVLPDKIIPATLFSPKVIMFYGMPKIGKTRELVNLENNLILEGDIAGTEPYDCLWFPLTNYKNYKETIQAVTAKGIERSKQGLKGIDLYPYRYISIDTIGTIEDIAIASLTEEFRDEAKRTSKQSETQQEALKDPTWTIADMPHGAGHGKIRTRVIDMVESMAKVCHKLIIMAHVRDKEIPGMANTTVKVTEIALMGRLGEILSARVDTIGYMYRSKDGPLKVSFQAGGNTTMGSRFRFLTGKDFDFSWDKIFPDEFGLPIPTE